MSDLQEPKPAATAIDPAVIQYIDTRMAKHKAEQDAKIAEQKAENTEKDAKIAALLVIIEKQKAALDDAKGFLDNLVDPRLQIWSAGTAVLHWQRQTRRCRESSEKIQD